MKSGSIRRIGIPLLLVAVVLAFALLVFRSGTLAPTRVTVHTVGEGNIAPALFGIGTVEARRAYLIGPTAAGRVRRVLVDVGDHVKAGQLLAEMEPVDLDERTASLEAAFARARSAVAAAEAQRLDVLARQRVAALNARRYEDLGARNFVSPSAVETKQQEQASADAAIQAADANLAGAKQDMARLGAERDGQRQQRANVRLLAPADGVVSARDGEPGSTLVAGQAVVRLIEPASLWVRLRLDQGRSAGLAVGLPADIVLRSDPSHPRAGKVARIEPLGDSVAEERIAQVAFAELPEGIAVGELVEATLRLPPPRAGLLLPNAGIRQQGGKPGVWLSRDGALQFVPVRLGSASLDGQVQVLEGLKAGDQVILHSDREIRPDSRIQVVKSLTGAGT